MGEVPAVFRILFVDDEQNVLDGLRRSMYSMRAEWAMEFVTSGESALASLAHAAADVVVADMRFHPRATGAAPDATLAAAVRARIARSAVHPFICNANCWVVLQ
jgi:CheY-like chemotaxis protein